MGNWKLLNNNNIMISLKTVGNLFDNFDDETVDHVEIKVNCYEPGVTRKN